jgi:hypothetical protein
VNFDSKILWTLDVTDLNTERAVFADATAAGCGVICVRSASPRWPSLIARAHAANLKIFAWRWPAVKPQPASHTHYFADDEAAFIAQTLIPAGLDGYVVDPESDSAGSVNDWNATTHAPLAARFCQTIKSAAAAGGKPFRFGTTSGCTYPAPNNRPNIPWAEFSAASDVLLPQSYWRTTDKRGRPVDINGGAPDKAIARGLKVWKRIANHPTIVPMAGELALITVQEINDYGAAMSAAGLRELHFYIDEGNVDPAKLTAIKAL